MAKKHKIKNNIDSLLEFVWLTAIFLVPLLFIRSLYNSFEVPKIVLFRTLTEILVFLYLIKLIFNGFPGFEYFKKRLKYFIPAIVFILFMIISTLFSDVGWFSFFGSWERWVGSLSWIHFLLFSIIVFLNLDSKKVKHILKTVIFSSVLICIYGILQYLSLDPFKWSYNVTKIGRIFSTTGQPNFLGSWLLLSLPIAFWGIKRKGGWFRILSGFAIILTLISLILTKSRGAIVGLLGMVAFLLFFYGWKKNKKISFVILIVFILGVSLVAYLNIADTNNDFVLNNSFLSRLQSFSDLERIGKYRLMHWGAAVDLIKKQPILGYGIATQRFYVPKYYKPEFAIYENPNIYLDHFHNDVIDMIFSLGIIGFLSYAFFLGYVFIAGLKYFLNNNKKEAQIIFWLLGGMMGYLVSILFSFHITSALVIFWSFVAIILYLVNKKEFSKFRPRFKTNFYKLGLSILLLSLTLFIIYLVNGKLLLSSHYLYKAKKAKLESKLEQTIDYHTKSLKFSPNNPFFKQEFALSLYQFAQRVQGNDRLKLSLVSHGIAQLRTIPENLKTIESIIWLPQLFSRKANITQEKSHFEKAEEYFQQAAKFSPKTALIYNKWCRLEIYKKDWGKAKKMCKKALSLYPDIEHPHMNLPHKKKVVNESLACYGGLVEVYKAKKEYKQAIEIVKKMEDSINKAYKKKNNNLLYVYNLFSSLYNKIGNKQKADFYKKQINNVVQDK